jgi:2-methylisocitrate lyase-like PEP mutase family enzyme
MDEGKKLWLNDLAVLAEAGYKIASYPGTVRYTVVRAVQQALAHLKQHRSSVGLKERLATADEYFAAVDLNKYLELEQKILPQQGGKAK